MVCCIVVNFIHVKYSNLYSFLFVELFYLAHKLVDLQPDQAIAWFAVGCYYYLIGILF